MRVAAFLSRFLAAFWHLLFPCQKYLKNNTCTLIQTEFLYWVIVGCHCEEIAAVSGSGNTDNQLSPNLLPNIRILFALYLKVMILVEQTVSI